MTNVTYLTHVMVAVLAERNGVSFHRAHCAFFSNLRTSKDSCVALVVIHESIDRHVGRKPSDSFLPEPCVLPAYRAHHVTSVLVGRVMFPETLPAESVSA